MSVFEAQLNIQFAGGFGKVQLISSRILVFQIWAILIIDTSQREFFRAMDAIKKKMEKLSNETATAEARIAHFEDIKVSYHQGITKVSYLILSKENWIFVFYSYSYFLFNAKEFFIFCKRSTKYNWSPKRTNASVRMVTITYQGGQRGWSWEIRGAVEERAEEDAGICLQL